MQTTGLGLALIGALSTSAVAQQLSGVVRDSASARPIPGAVLLLKDSAGIVLGRNITNEQGRYTIALTSAIRRMRVQRIGFRPRELDVPSFAGTGTMNLDV